MKASEGVCESVEQMFKDWELGLICLDGNTAPSRTTGNLFGDRWSFETSQT